MGFVETSHRIGPSCNILRPPEEKMSTALPFDDKVALVTGAASGIGRSIAVALAERGARVLAHDVRESGREVAEEIGGAFLQADLSDMEQTRGLARQALDAEGRIDILVNNAGFQHMSDVESFPEETWAKLVQVLLVAPFQLIKHLIPGMKERRWGRIVNMSSIHGLVASPYKSAYVAAKHGLVGLTKTAALEVAACGVTVNAICPGYVNTALVRNQIADLARIRGMPESEVIERVILEPQSVKRMVEPSEVAQMALFLAGPDSQSITGSTQVMDGGWSAR